MANISAEFQILFHPDMTTVPKEVALVYTFDGKSYDDYFANKITDKNWSVSLYDLSEGQKMEFFIRCVIKDGRLMLGRKEGKNYQIQIRANSESGNYKAQIRLADENMVYAGRRCLICDQIIPKTQNMCKTEQCNAVYCPQCNRMLPPYSNFCPWDKISFNI